MSTPPIHRITFVCLGNICRSPLAEGVFKHLAKAAGRESEFHVESAGVGGWHVGETPDFRAQQVARNHGIRLESIAQKIHPRDLERFDLILALDEEIYNDLQRMATNPGQRSRIHMLRETDPQATQNRDVPDPYYGNMADFEYCYQLIERSCKGWLERISSSAQS